MRRCLVYWPAAAPRGEIASTGDRRHDRPQRDYWSPGHHLMVRPSQRRICQTQPDHTHQRGRTEAPHQATPCSRCRARNEPTTTETTGTSVELSRPLTPRAAVFVGPAKTAILATSVVAAVQRFRSCLSMHSLSPNCPQGGRARRARAANPSPDRRARQECCEDRRGTAVLEGRRQRARNRSGRN
jgi:hypothetical protein